jgi:hypothetical protein
MTSEITNTKEAMESLHRASCINLVLLQTIREMQFEEPVCAAALAETLETAYDLMNDVHSFLDRVEMKERAS